MYGHLPIIKMRQQGTKPKAIFVNDFHCKTAIDWSDPGRKYGEQWNPDNPTVSVAGDEIRKLDLRFLVGVTVHISSPSEQRAKELFSRAIEMGAHTVGACHSIVDARPSDPLGWFEIYRKGEE